MRKLSPLGATPAHYSKLATLKKLEARLEWPMLGLSFVWLGLMILEFTRGLSRPLEIASNLIWAAFVLDFLVKLFLAPSKWKFIKSNWLTTLALLFPALRIFRITRAVRVLQAARAARGIRLARVFTSLNRGIAALKRGLGKRGFAYVMALSLLVVLAGAAGMYAFEKESGQLDSYGTALWWTAMVLTTMGSDTFPVSAEGRLLCLALAIYGFAVFGYVTAVVASFFIGREKEENTASTLEENMNAVILELKMVRAELAELKQMPQIKNPPTPEGSSDFNAP